MKRFTEKALAATAFLSALGVSLVVLPLAYNNQALALDAKAPGPGGPEHHFPLPSERVEARIAYAKVALKITDAQSKQWNAFADFLRKQAKERDAMFEAMRGAKHDTKMTIIDRLQEHQKRLTKQAAAAGEMLTAVQPLYAVLTDDQKQTAEELMRPKWGGHEGGHWGHGPGGRGPEGRGPGGPGGPGPDGHGPGPQPGPAQ